MPHLHLTPKDDLSSFRRIAIGTWRRTYDPQVYGAMSLNMDEALAYLDAFRERTGRRVTITHLMAKAVAGVLAGMPEANAILRFNRLYLRDDVAVFFQVALEDEHGEIDLSGATIHHADKKSLLQIVDEFQATVDKVRSRTDEQLESTRTSFKRIPGLLLNVALQALSFLLYTLNLDLTAFGLPRDPFGSCMITNIGSLGLEEAYVPLVPYSRVPLILATGAVVRTPVVADDGTITVARTMKVFATFDHRLLDGTHAAHMSKHLKAWFDAPWEHFGPLPEEPREVVG